MIDLIRFSKKNLSEVEKNTIITKSRLNVRYDKDGFKCYENGKIKDLQGGLSITIDKENLLKIDGSLHKYHSFLNTGKSSNFDTFTMYQAKETINKIIDTVGFEPINTLVNHYEIGLNLDFEIDVITFINKAYSIGIGATEKTLYINPKYRKERLKTTEIHYNFRVSYKMYDKIFEIIDKRGNAPNDKNILRIETVNRRIEKISLIDFFADNNLSKIQNVFFNKWDNLNFDFNVLAPKGTHQSKITLAKELILNGTENIKLKYQKLAVSGSITPKIYRSIQTFINNWKTTQYDYKIDKTEIKTIWANRYSIEKQKLTENLHKE